MVREFVACRAQQNRRLHWRGVGSRNAPQQIVLSEPLADLTRLVFVLRNFENELAPHCGPEIPVAAHNDDKGAAATGYTGLIISVEIGKEPICAFIHHGKAVDDNALSRDEVAGLLHRFSNVVRYVACHVDDFARGENIVVTRTDQRRAKLERIADGGAISGGARQRENSPRKSCSTGTILDDAPVDDSLSKTRAREIQH